MPVQLDADVLQRFIDNGGVVEEQTTPATGATVDLNPSDVPATPPQATASPFPTQRVAGIVQGAADRIAAPAARAHDAIAAQPTPGGVGVLLLALMFFVWAVVPFGGHTRLEWLWYTITGRARLKGRRDLKARAAQSGGGGSSWDDSGGGGSSWNPIVSDGDPSGIQTLDATYEPEYDAFTPDLYDDQSVFS